MNLILACLVMLLVKKQVYQQKVGLENEINISDNCCPTLGHQALNCRYLTRNTKDYGD